MFEKSKAITVFNQIFSRKDVSQSYQPVDESHPWYNALKKNDEDCENLYKIDHQVLEIKGEDGISLKALFFQNSSSDKLYFGLQDYCANAIREFAGEALYFYSKGYSVIVPFFRGHGASQGSFTSLGHYESHDIRLWLDSLKDKNFSSVLFHGYGMGANTALYLTQDENISIEGFIIDSPEISYTSVLDRWLELMFSSDKKKDTIRSFLYAYFEQTFLFKPESDDFSEMVRNSSYPILFLDHEKDEIHGSQALSSSLSDPNYHFFMDSYHNTAFYDKKEEYTAEIEKFLSSVKGEFLNEKAE